MAKPKLTVVPVIPIAQMHFCCAADVAEQFINSILVSKDLDKETTSPEAIYNFLWEMYMRDPYDSMVLNAILALTTKVIWSRKRCESDMPTAFSA